MSQAGEQQQRGWFSRNWVWFVPLGCLLPVLICAGCIGLFVTGIFSALKSAEPYQHAVAAAKANPQVIEALGEPIEEGFAVSGNINIDGAGGNADLSIPISGPKGEATIYVVATKAAGQWSYTTLEVQFPSGERVQLE